ncbi:MAG: hypothetical protein U1E81_14610 [Xanthobacteraceae bacterium]
MAISGSLTFKNRSHETLKVTGITWLDDDAERGGIQIGDKIPPNATATASMSNESVIPPKGIGIDITFTAATDPGINIGIHLEIPAIGPHSLNTLSASNLSATYSGGSNNQYTAAIDDA